MPKYMLTYIGGNQPSTAEEGKAHFAKYMSWLQELGDSALSPANPLKQSVLVNPDGSVTEESATNMSGFTLITADSLEAAVNVAKRCPFLEIGGQLEVSEIVDMPPPK